MGGNKNCKKQKMNVFHALTDITVINGYIGYNGYGCKYQNKNTLRRGHPKPEGLT